MVCSLATSSSSSWTHQRKPPTVTQYSGVSLLRSAAAYLACAFFTLPLNKIPCFSAAHMHIVTCSTRNEELENTVQCQELTHRTQAHHPHSLEALRETTLNPASKPRRLYCNQEGCGLFPVLFFPVFERKRKEKIFQSNVIQNYRRDLWSIIPDPSALVRFVSLTQTTVIWWESLNRGVA